MTYLRSRLLLGLLALAVVGDFVAIRSNLQNASSLVFVFDKVKGSLSVVRNFTHRSADVFCNNPDECKQAIDQIFGIVSNIPEDLVERFIAFLRKPFNAKNIEKDGSTVQKNVDVAKKGALDFAQESGEMQGNVAKAENIIRSLIFSSYDENSICELKEGIPDNEYDITVDEIADLIGLPAKLKMTIKRARTFKDGNVQAIRRMSFKDQDGNLVFGRIAVVRRGDVLDIAYSLHSVEYELKSKQRNQNNAEIFDNFADNLNDENDKKEEGNAVMEISLKLRDDFLAFFHKQAVRGFVKNCKYVLKTLTHGQEAMRLAQGVVENDEVDGENELL